MANADLDALQRAAKLKDDILDNTVDVSLLILVCGSNSGLFVADQYINLIAKNNGLEKVYIDSLEDYSDYSTYSSINSTDSELKIYRTDTLAGNIDWNNFSNTIIVCNKVDKKVKDRVKEYLVEIPKLLTWHIQDYIDEVGHNINSNLKDELISRTSENIFRINNELEKSNLFENSNEILQEILYEKDNDFYFIQTFNFTDAIIRRDLLTIKQALSNLQYWDSDPIFITSLLLNKYKQICVINGNKKLNYEDLGLTDKQYRAVKYYYKDIPEKEIKEKIKFLSSINLRLTLGKIGFESPAYFVTYLVNNLLN